MGFFLSVNWLRGRRSRSKGFSFCPSIAPAASPQSPGNRAPGGLGRVLAKPTGRAFQGAQTTLCFFLNLLTGFFFRIRFPIGFFESFIACFMVVQWALHNMANVPLKFSTKAICKWNKDFSIVSFTIPSRPRPMSHSAWALRRYMIALAMSGLNLIAIFSTVESRLTFVFSFFVFFDTGYLHCRFSSV